MSPVDFRPASQRIQLSAPTAPSSTSPTRMARTSASSAGRLQQAQNPTLQLQNASMQPRSLVQELMAGVKQVRELLGIVQSAQANRPAGVGLMQGAREFSGQVNLFFDALGSLGSAYANGGSAALEQQALQIGSGAQSFILNEFKAETLSQIAGTLGLDPSKASVGDIAEAAYGYLTGNTLSGAQGVASAATGATTAVDGAAAAEGATGLSSATGQIIGAAGAAYSLYNLISGFGEMSLKEGLINGAATGAYVGSFFGPPGTLIGGAIGGVVGAISSLFKKSGKSKEQKARDKVRDAFEKLGLLDSDHNVTLADGTKYNIGKDGKHKYTNLDGTQRGAFEIDPSNPMSGQVIGWVNPIVEQLVGGDEKLKVAFVGYFTNAALSNAKNLEEARQNVLAMFANLQLTPEKIAGGLQQMNAAGQLRNDVFEAYLNGIITLYQPASTEAMTSPVNTGAMTAEATPPPAVQTSDEMLAAA